MTERDAIKKGYTFSGIWDSSFRKDDVKARAKELREKGNKAIMIPRNNGISVFWKESPANKAARELQQAEANVRWASHEVEEAMELLNKRSAKLAEAEKLLELARAKVAG
jgi:hypothetical protein